MSLEPQQCVRNVIKPVAVPLQVQSQCSGNSAHASAMRSLPRAAPPLHCARRCRNAAQQPNLKGALVPNDGCSSSIATEGRSSSIVECQSAASRYGVLLILTLVHLALFEMQLERQTVRVQALIAQFDRAAIDARVAARVYVHGPNAREGLSSEYDSTVRNLDTAAADYAQRAPSRAESLRWFTQEAATQHDVVDAVTREAQAARDAIDFLRDFLRMCGAVDNESALAARHGGCPRRQGPLPRDQYTLWVNWEGAEPGGEGTHHAMQPVRLIVNHAAHPEESITSRAASASRAKASPTSCCVAASCVNQRSDSARLGAR
ncbi:hypothetical protein JKP88DRAFT_242970 [Tribonema minus]|uniref:Uncharacterized protein n=1 Tax=Tribonema minus TaxID=303371 RepID=A0A835ZF80_9STRA|nr:hypothetical protein JKP88DRAFT_242970 [Tribonema minus]